MTIARLPAALCRLLVLTVAAATLAGCQSYSAPTLSAAEAHATERTGDGAAMRFTLDARNDNDVSLPLRRVEYTVELNGRQVFSGTRSAEATLRRKGTQQIELPAVVRLDNQQNADLVSGTVRYRLAGDMYYVTPGQLAEVLFDAGVRTPSASFSIEGDIDLSAARFTPAADTIPSTPQTAASSATPAPAPAASPSATPSATPPSTP
jgi:LEA14-like dessication related protein